MDISILERNTHVGLVYDKNIDIFGEIFGYVDFDYDEDWDKRSLTGYVFTLCGSVISWKATLQSIVALSTTEVEYMVAMEAVKKIVWLKDLVGDLRVDCYVL